MIQACFEQLDAGLARMPKTFVSGKVTEVLGLIIEGSLMDIPVGAACEIISHEGKTTLAEVIGLRGTHAILMPIGSTSGIKIGDSIVPLNSEATVQVSEELLGRVLDGCGAPMDGKAPPLKTVAMPLYRAPFSSVNRKIVHEPLSLGIKAIDAFMTCGVGMRMMVMAGSGVGKSTLMGMMARSAQADVNVIGLIGERGREVREFLEESLGKEGLARSVVVIATSDAPPLVRMRAAFVATTIAEFFRDKGKKVLLMMDSLTRFAMASREVGLALGEPPTVKGYTPSLFSTLPKLLERVGTTEGRGSITGLYTILTEADDIQDPVADTVRSIVDGHIVLSRKLATQGFYPPIDVLQSLSRVMTHVTSEEHQKQTIQIRRYLSFYEEMADYIKMGVYSAGKNPEIDKAIQKNDQIRNFLEQNVSEEAPYARTLQWLKELSWEGAA